MTLRDPLTRTGEAAEVARAVLEGPDEGAITLGGAEVGVSHVFRTSDGEPWSAVGSLGDTLEMIKNGLLAGVLLDADGGEAGRFAMTTIGKLFDVGPTHDLIGHPKGCDPRGAFTFTPVAGSADAVGLYRAMWATNSSVQKFLVADPTHKGTVHRKDRASPMWERRTRLFYQRNMRWTAQAVLSVTTASDAMGGRAWTGLHHSDERVMKAFALWANSIYGMVAYWATGQRTQNGRSSLQIGAMSGVKCPGFDKLGRGVLEQAAEEFDGIVKDATPLRPAYLAASDPVRDRIGKAASDMLGMPEYDHPTLARLWCAEPSVQKTPRKGRSAERPPGGA